MSYTISTPEQYAYFTASYADPIALMNLCNSALSNQFQTQNARTTVQQQFGDIWKNVPSVSVRFPETGFYVYRLDSTIEPLVTALLNAFDTRNRVIEVDNPSNPTTAETLNANQRIDDATVNIRACINNLMNPLNRGVGYLNRASFEATSQLTWATAE